MDGVLQLLFGFSKPMILSGLAIGIIYLVIRDWISYERSTPLESGGGAENLKPILRVVPILFLVFVFLLISFS